MNPRLPAFASGLLTSAFVLMLSMSLPLGAEELQTQENNVNVTPESMAFVAQNSNESIENRVQALNFISQHPNQNSLVAAARGLKDENAMIREAAIGAVAPYPLAHRYRMVSPLLAAEESSVRSAAIIHLLKDFEQLQMGQQANVRAQADELITQLIDDQSYTQQLLLADIYRWTFRYQSAQAIYENLLTYDQKSVALFLSFSHNYYAQGKNQETLDILEKGIQFDNEDATLHYAKALALVRLQQKEVAAESMKIATELAPDNAYYWYLNGVLQEPLEIEQSIKSFEKAYLISGSPENLYAMCDIYIRNAHQNTEQCITALAEIAPQEVVDGLRQQQGQ
ncbi:hypothetical protein GCM10007916_22310 [Psychromonas marina]|uniref:Tetratricopeptide repeat protein n=1 Tax=Psychromonas marina TaxID=88364 RepID=A0ABQ6E143_9GAMM|nr:hypothetical protein [Psychromonas marina]GLS91162.1 hypothetical protein GCM10007916_22310 [Psychromonas marina]